MGKRHEQWARHRAVRSNSLPRRTLMDKCFISLFRGSGRSMCLHCCVVNVLIVPVCSRWKWTFSAIAHDNVIGNGCCWRSIKYATGNGCNYAGHISVWRRTRFRPEHNLCCVLGVQSRRCRGESTLAACIYELTTNTQPIYTCIHGALQVRSLFYHYTTPGQSLQRGAYKHLAYTQTPIQTAISRTK